jgi:hypothetical protein
MLIDSAEWRYDILEEHYEELESLWNRRFRATRSAEWDARALQRIDARTDAHVDALALAGVQALPVLDPGLRAAPDELPLAAAATSALARADDERLVSVFIDHATPGMLAALVLEATPLLRHKLVAGSRAADALVQASVCFIAAAHGDPVDDLFVSAWRAHALADVRCLAWRTEARAPRAASDNEYRAAIRDSDPAVRSEALSAAARTRKPWLIDYLVENTTEPSPSCVEELRLLAFLSEAQQAEMLVARVCVAALGDARFGLLAACGRRPAVEALLGLMRDGTPVEAALAGRAFTRITGVDVSLPERIPLVPQGEEPDELADQINLCDVARAQHSWRALQSTMLDARWVRGLALDGVPPNRLCSNLDLESRWGAQLRAAHFGTGSQLLLDTEAFPFRVGLV